jgi:hypothetical protein
MSTAPDRIESLKEQDQVTGIDFINVDTSQTILDIYFLRLVTTLASPLPGTIDPSDILIYSTTEGLPAIEVLSPLTWLVVDGQDVLRVITKSPGDFTLYKFKIADARIDPYYNDIPFSFKANCPSDLDCAPPEHECPPDDMVDFPVDYLARDFWSFRRALLDFASLRYPDWTDRLEADAGVMMAELMSAVGDEMAYYQDRVAREGFLETATQRRSIRRHARLVDYHMHDGLGAFVWLEIIVEDPGSRDVDAGTAVFALSSGNDRIDFEVGYELNEAVTIPKKKYNVNASRNVLFPHLWDEDQTCLPVGTTSLYLEGHHKADLPFDHFAIDPNTGKPTAGKWVLIKTNPTNPAQPVRKQMVRLTTITDTVDLVLLQNITFIQWEQEHALAFEFDVTVLTVSANMLPATAGITQKAYFLVNKTPGLSAAAMQAFMNLGGLEDIHQEAVHRKGHDGTPAPRFTLPDIHNRNLVYLGATTDTAKPEIVLERLFFDGALWQSAEFWHYKRSLIGVNSSGSEDTDFTLDDGSWQRVVGYQRIGKEIEHRDYAFNNGATIRFGDDEFGKLPDDDSVFHVRYRLGGGRSSNVSSGSINAFKSGLSFSATVTNPLPALNGVDPETPVELRQVVADAFRAVTYRAVRPEDYAEAAERLPWVQKAGAAFRWTGSWLTAFVTVDPKGKVVLEPKERKELQDQMDRFRQAGREVYVSDPEYANIDLEIEICIDASSYSAEVKERVMEALMGKKGLWPKEGYFSPDRFTFGTWLERSSLEAAIQEVPGIKAVEEIRFRRRGWFGWRNFKEYSYDPGKNVIIRIENDPLHPERGTFKLYTHGGL